MLINGLEFEIKPFADLRGADLSGANLRGANLSGADLRGANLWGANLSLVKGLPIVNSYLPGITYHAYKAVGKDFLSLMVHGGHTKDKLDYHEGKEVVVDNANTDKRILCGAGVNVSDLQYYNNNHPSEKVMLVQFDGIDVACVPYGSDGKFRLHRCKVVREVTEEVKRFIEEQSNGPRMNTK